MEHTHTYANVWIKVSAQDFAQRNGRNAAQKRKKPACIF